jgi:triosephosphate isomerase
MGLIAPPPLDYVADVCGIVRETLRSLLPQEVAESVRVLYGGQVNPRNIEAIAAEASIDGVLVGAASTSAQNFSTLVRAYSGRALPQT